MPEISHRYIRHLTVAVFFGLCTLALLARLVDIQLVQHRQYETLAAQEHGSSTVLSAHRGTILDRNGFPLALSVDAYSLQINRDAWKDDATAQRVATALSPVVGQPPDAILAAVRSGSGHAIPLASGLSYEAGQRLADMGLPGVVLTQTSKREYPEGDLASNVLGFVGADGNGLTGIEQSLNSDLAGTAGLAKFQQDAFGDPIGDSIQTWKDPQAGDTVTLTIDRQVQEVAEQDLDAAISKTGASGGTVIAMDPTTGAIRALASRPSFEESTLNFSDPSQTPLYRDRAITDTYEPGSVFKLITMAAALDSGVVTPNTTYDDTGAFRIGTTTIENWDHSAHGITTMTTVIVDSLNTGAAWVSQRLGATRFYDYVQRFGFGSPTGVELNGEAAGEVRTADQDGWSPVDLATNSYGQGISVTPLQLITAVSAIVNGGLLMRPYIVQSISGPDGVHETQPATVRRVISDQAASEVRQMMQEELAAYTLAQVPGYSGGGKSGTAYIPEANGYLSERTIPSYIEFITYDQPRIVLLVKLDDLDTNALGGVVAAPMASDILGRIAPVLGIAPDQPSTSHAAKP